MKKIFVIFFIIIFSSIFIVSKADAPVVETIQGDTFSTEQISNYSTFGEQLLNDPKINAYLDYNSDRYYYVSHSKTAEITKYNVTKMGYVATYVIANPISNSKTLVNISVERLDSIQVGYSYSLGDSFSATISSELASSVDAVVASTKSGISTYFNRNFGTSAATSVDATYTLSDYFKANMSNSDRLRILYTQTEYNFITLVYDPYIKKTGAWLWEKVESGYNVFAYLTTAVGISTVVLKKN
ncbi:MAG: hypothetical protein NC310_00620 [Roseburia sp.]|nr:hypothetical protein [Anaeroplasma bactoclasticum]MCM1195555.1 hypothetical protein [Roseburia sp.]MCM1555970.1 hypothetical protein [Anaeroplasma bactoclasticum]